MSFGADSPHVSRVVASSNMEPRRLGPPSMLLLHYTGLMDVERAIHWLSVPESKVSCHYVVAEDGAIVQMVPEHLRAWHAGVASWHGETDVNSLSIGIEISNPGHELGYPDFPAAQMRALAELARDIIRRNDIAPACVLAHSDVAPARKIDPGEKFDWEFLFREGIGHWVAPEPIAERACAADADLPVSSITAFQQLLKTYGYGVDVTGTNDPASRFVVKAFQRHFRPARVDGEIDRSTFRTAEKLLAASPAPRR